MPTLRPKLSQFAAIQDFPYAPRYVDFEGARMHYVDEGSGETILALHGEPTWSYLYRKFVPVLSDYRFVAPDLIGFGKSDKLAEVREYSFEYHFRSLENLIDELALDDITLIVQDWGGLLGLSLLGAHPERFRRVVILNTFLPKGKPLPLAFRLWQWHARYNPLFTAGGIVQFGTAQRLSKEVVAAYDAPFPTERHMAGPRALPMLVPSRPSDGGVARMNVARQVLSEWRKPALVMFSDKDPVLGGLAGFFYDLIPTANDRPRVTIEGASHFLQEERGEEIAGWVKGFMGEG